MIKKTLLASFICSLALSSQLVNGVAAVIENEAITLYEVERVKKELNLNDQRALDLLIRDRLEQAQIKSLGITASPFEVNQRIDSIAKQNGMSTAELRDNLEYKQGIKFIDFRNDIQKSIQQEKLYKNILSDAGKNINDNMARAYYEANLAQFSTFEEANVVLYRSNDPELLTRQLASGTKALKGVETREITLNSSAINPSLVAIITSTDSGTFTQVLRSQAGYDAFYIKSKSGVRTASFEQAKNQILNNLHQIEQDKAASEYFEKLRAKAKLTILR